MDTGNYRNRVLIPLAEKLGLPKLNFQVLRRTTSTLAQKKGSVKDIQAHLRHAKADTTANEYMQELPESVKQMVDSVYGELRAGRKRGVVPFIWLVRNIGLEEGDGRASWLVSTRHWGRAHAIGSRCRRCGTLGSEC